MKATLEMLAAEASSSRVPEVVPRQTTIRRMKGKVSVLTGMRRTGKTFLCFQRMHELIAAGVARERLMYVNFEDDRLAGLGVGDLHWLVDAFYGANPALKDLTCHFFFDEVQCVAGWETFVRRLLDTENAEITLTGSSAKLLSREIGTAMRGRALTTEIFPLSFRDYCRFHDLAVPDKPLYSVRDRLTLAKAADAYLLAGGFPEVQRQETSLWRAVLQDYADVVILRDVIDRHGLTNYPAAKALARHVLQNPGQLLSVTRLARTFEQIGIACSKNTLFDLLDYLHDAYFCFPVELHDRSVRRRQVNPRKVYAADTGLCRAVATGETRDAGAALESAVYASLRRRGVRPDYAVTPRKAGVDFVYEEDGRWHFVQACLSMDNATTAEREWRALDDALNLHPQATRMIVTRNEEYERDGVRVVPLWRWLLEH